MVLLLFDLGSGEIFLIVLAIFLVFGPGKIPELARGLGKFINEIKRASEDVKTEINREADRIDRDKKNDAYMKQKETKEKQPDETQNENTEKVTSRAKTTSKKTVKKKEPVSRRKKPAKKPDVAEKQKTDDKAKPKSKPKSKSAGPSKKKTKAKTAKQEETVTNEIKMSRV